MRTFNLLFAACLSIVVFLSSCKKDDSQTNPNPPDLETPVTVSIEGYVTDENDAPVTGALVKVGASSAATDQYGFFTFENVQVIRNAAVVTVTHSGYFKGIRTFIAGEGIAREVRIKLLPKTVIGTFDASAGGGVTTTDGLKIDFPEDAVMDASGTLYSGMVTVAAKWLDPSATDVGRIMPGDLRGLTTSGELRTLLAYGMAAVEMTGSAGQPLQVATGKKSTLTIPLPSSLQTQAPASVSQWYFDEEKGLWNEAGVATKTGNAYVAEVSHYSFWSFDTFQPYVQLDLSVTDANGIPVPHARVMLTMVNYPYSSGHGITNSNGFVSGHIPAGTDLTMEIFAGVDCTVPVYTQNIPGTATDVSLGNISLPAGQVITLSGNLLNCSMLPVSDGYLFIKMAGQYYRYNVGGNGAFSIPVINCPSTTDILIIGGDYFNGEESNPQTLVLNSNSLNLGNIQACGTQADEYLQYSINGVNYSFTGSSDSISISPIPGNSWQVFATNSTGTRYAALTFEGTDILSVGHPGNALMFWSSDINDTINDVRAAIIPTESQWWGTGGFLGANLNGTETGLPPANNTYNISLSFRVRN